ncbi:uncharacterized protein V1516DRAFT_682586 [Lipomyces oligophaga]|uniref:uncharacterized protein n=1 Tax=Lipomyces oligophaga TaxID=45792 RepID=UPI0034CE4420
MAKHRRIPAGDNKSKRRRHKKVTEESKEKQNPSVTREKRVKNRRAKNKKPESSSADLVEETNFDNLTRTNENSTENKATTTIEDPSEGKKQNRKRTRKKKIEKKAAEDMLRARPIGHRSVSNDLPGDLTASPQTIEKTQRDSQRRASGRQIPRNKHSVRDSHTETTDHPVQPQSTNVQSSSEMAKTEGSGKNIRRNRPRMTRTPGKGLPSDHLVQPSC